MENHLMNSKSPISIPNNRYMSLKDYKAQYEHRILPLISKHSFNSLFDSNSKINNLLESKEDFLRNTHITSKSFNFRKSGNMANDFEAKTLLNFYNFNGRKDNFHNEDDSSKELFNKLKQYSGLKHEEKQNISRNMKSFDTVHTKKNHSKGITMQSFVHDKEIYENPFKSLSQIKLNKNIYSNVVNIYTNKLQDSYVYTLSKYFGNEEKQRNMPGIRVSLSEAANLKQQELQEAISQNKFGEKKEESSHTNRVSLAASSGMYFPEFQGEFITGQKNKPRARALASMNIIKDNIYLFGGLSEARLNDFWICEVKNNYNWKQIQPKGKEPIGRFGHTSIYYDRSLYIYGGSLKKNPALPNEGQDLLIYNIRKNSIYFENCGNKSEVKWRRSHIAECIGSFMIIHGGINDEDEKILNDCFILDLNYMIWTKADIKGKFYSLAYHASSLVVQSEIRTNQDVNVYKFPDTLTIKSDSKKTKLEGIYVFGGLDQHRKIQSELKVLRLGKRPLEWFTPKTQGTPPDERISCNITYYEELNFLLINGGRNDLEKNVFFNDIFILNLHTFNWIKVKTFSNEPKDRAQHSSILYHNKLIIFGGICATKYLGSDLFVVNFDVTDKKIKSNISNNEIKSQVEEEKEIPTNEKRRKSLLIKEEENKKDNRRKSIVIKEEVKSVVSNEEKDDLDPSETKTKSKLSRSEKHLEKIRQLSKLKSSVLHIVNNLK